jgi:drug/metabolite transporter (DMT)-like permease
VGTTLILALGAAMFYGCGVALQFREASKMPESESVRLGLLVRLFKRPLWVLGIIFDVLGFALQAVALASGSLVIVEPIVATSLVFSVLTVSALNRTRPEGRDIAAVILVVVGLGSFLAVAAPEVTSHDSADGGAWLACGLSLLGAIVLLAMAARGRSAKVRGSLLAVAAGMANGFVAVSSKAFAQKMDDDGFLRTLGSWEPYLLAASGILATLLIQSAYQADAPLLSFPLIEVTGPLTAAVIGVALFGERLSFSGGRAPIVILALAVMIGGIVALGREPIVPHTPRVSSP